MNKLKNIPCNVITGFLGSGKTTAILHLLSHKPADERWAVLVNEFGQMGIDGDVMASQHAYVKEIPGGCMCCTAGVPMQVALNALIKQSHPHRLLIEPSGIGHPRQIIQQLSSPPFNNLFDMRACITLLDPRHLQDSRYTENDLFQDQMNIADVLVANKTDQCNAQDQQIFIETSTQQYHKTTHAWVEQGQLDLQYLDLPHSNTEVSFEHSKFQPITNSPASSEVYQSLSWIFESRAVFDYVAVMALISSLKLERIKALLKTDHGDVFINSVLGSSSVLNISALDDSRIEIIHHSELCKDQLVQKFKHCLKS